MEFKEKFIAFVDVLGFKSMIAQAECGEARSLEEIDQILAKLKRVESKEFFDEFGPQMCPMSQKLQRDLDFEITQVSDCTIVSAEISPAGAINIVNHCWAVATTLLLEGVMVRGYITRGKIFHEGSKFYGSGYQHAFESESSVIAFRKEADEKGTPFIEIDKSICDYISTTKDECAVKMFERLTSKDGTTRAVFPFKSIQHSFVLTGFGLPPFNPEKERSSNNNTRGTIKRLKNGLMKHVDENNERAMNKTRHYLAALDVQLANCDAVDQEIDRLMQPFSHLRM